MRILLSGGGTAGHINPAIAIAEILLRNRPGTAVAFVGTPGGMEERLLRAAGYPMYPVKAMGFSRSLSPRNLAAAWYALTSPRAARRILADFRPDAVIGTGGYVCYPILRAASGAGIPCALHESNAVPGLTVRKLAPRMDALWLNFAESADALPKTRARIVHTGNPMRAGFSTVSRAQARQEMGLSPDDFMVLSFGGSRGAEPINRAVQEAFPVLFGRIPELFWVHGCGTAHYDAFCAACRPEAFPRARVLPYLEKMPVYMAAADLIICRAGAMTLSEAALCGKCVILIPSPYVANNHQYKNAALLAAAGAGHCLTEEEAKKGALIPLTERLFRAPDERAAAAAAIRAFAMPDAGRRIYEEICRLTAKKPV